jgi:hypothetical protein
MKTTIEMNPEEILKELEEIAEQIPLHIHYEEMKAFEFHVQDGGCKVRGEPHVFIDRRRPAREKISILAGELKKCNLEGIYIHPYIRERILTGGVSHSAEESQ